MLLVELKIEIRFFSTHKGNRCYGRFSKNFRLRTDSDTATEKRVCCKHFSIYTEFQPEKVSETLTLELTLLRNMFDL